MGVLSRYKWQGALGMLGFAVEFVPDDLFPFNSLWISGALVAAAILWVAVGTWLDQREKTRRKTEPQHSAGIGALSSHRPGFETISAVTDANLLRISDMMERSLHGHGDYEGLKEDWLFGKPLQDGICKRCGRPRAWPMQGGRADANE